MARLPPQPSPAASPSPARPAAADLAETIIKGRTKVLVIMRGLPGSGKSTLVKALTAQGGWVCSADDYFLDEDGTYVYDAKQIGAAHEWAQKKALLLMQQALSPVIVDNTNTQCWEARPYVLPALEHGYAVEITTPTTPWAFDPVQLAKKNAHGVPEAAIRRMLQRWEKDFTVERIVASHAPGHRSPSPNAHKGKSGKRAPASDPSGLTALLAQCELADCEARLRAYGVTSARDLEAFEDADWRGAGCSAEEQTRLSEALQVLKLSGLTLQ